MILVVGIPSETPLQMVRDRLDEARVPYITLNQRAFARCRIVFEVCRGIVTGSLTLEDRTFRLEDFRAVYTRMMDDRNLPELRGEPLDSDLRKHCRGFHEALTRWMEIAPGCVINRCVPMGSNASKPYQTQLIREHGFRIPETLMTTDPELVRNFLETHERVVFKSASAMRSIVQTLGEADLKRLEDIRWCPTQFQAFVDGTNVRVHVIGDRVYATAVSTEATDYRYAKRQIGRHAELRPVDLSSELAQRCIALAASLGLGFAGIDLKITPDDEVYCFEVNPSPAFSYYESNTRQRISEGVAAALMRGERGVG